MRTFLTAITMALFFSTSVFASSIYMPHQVPVVNQDCYQGPGIGLHYETGIGGWVCTIDEQNNQRERPAETTADTAEETVAATEATN